MSSSYGGFFTWKDQSFAFWIRYFALPKGLTALSTNKQPGYLKMPKRLLIRCTQ